MRVLYVVHSNPPHIVELSQLSTASRIYYGRKYPWATHFVINSDGICYAICDSFEAASHAVDSLAELH